MDNHRKVVIQYGFKYFQLPNGRFARAIVVNGELVYADDNPVWLPEDEPQEPSDLEFIQMLKQDRS